MTKHAYLAKIPLLLELNRVKRLYTGGRLLNRWQGLPEGEDSADSEEFLISTAEYIGFGHPVENGLSRTRLPDGSYITLKQLISEDPEAFLGLRYAHKCHGHCGVLTRVGDSNVRLVIQCHPNAEMAQKYFRVPFGKTEAWVIADTRSIDGIEPYLYCGFRPGVTRELWESLFQEQNVEAMLACMHRFEVAKGDTVLIPAGMPHAMGSGCLFIEIHEPCDFTIRPERNYSQKILSDEEMHYGLGFDTMLDFFDYTTHTREEMKRLCFPQPIVQQKKPESTLTSLLRYENTPCFAVDRLSVCGSEVIPPFDGHRVLIAEHGAFCLEWEDGNISVPQGRGVFLPAGIENLQICGTADVLIAYPFQTD